MRQGRTIRALIVVAALGIAGVVAFGIFAWRPAFPHDTAAPPAAETQHIVDGARLAAIGNCNVCHTRDRGAVFAGGRPIATPFGTVYSTNITPDFETGLGGWSQAAFARAMREGVSRDGRHLYPAFPYDHMTRMRTDDIDAVYAFLMTRRPVQAVAPANELPFPLNIRALVAGWKLLFLDQGTHVSEPARGEDWNRGAYLVEGLAHCGACHTPRNLLGAEQRDRPYAGGQSDGWTAPALTGTSPAAVPWDTARLHAYLRDGFDPLHGRALGPMAPVSANLAQVPDDDVRAISIYVASLIGAPTPERQAGAEQALAVAGRADRISSAPSDLTGGAAVYAGACALCHGDAGRSPALHALDLGLSSTLRLPKPDNLVRVIREGVHPTPPGAGAIMPGFADALTDAQIESLTTYLRTQFAELPAWTGVAEAIRAAKRDDAEKARQAALARRPE